MAEELIPAAERLDTLPPGIPERTLGWEALAFAATYLRHVDGKKAGQRWEFTPRQARFVLWFYAVDENGDWEYGHASRRLSKGSGKSPFAAVMAIIELLAPVRFSHFDESLPGKCVGKPVDMPWVQLVAASIGQPLALDTEVRTTDGWKLVRDLHVGDFVFGSDGCPQEVKRETEVFYDRECFRVTFDDGESIVADAGHGWTVSAKNAHGDKFETVTMTTKELKEYKDSRKRGSLRIPVVPVHYPEADLGVDPYLLGFWLGDGNRNNGSFAIDWRLKDELESIFSPRLREYEQLNFSFAKNNSGTVYLKRMDGICPRGHEYIVDRSNQAVSNGNPACKKCYCYPRSGYNDPKLPSFMERLRAIGVLKNKHIPEEYMVSSYSQRLDLLRGLMDSDGSIDKHGRATFTNVDRRLIDGIEALLDSLGYKWREYSTNNGAFRVQFMPRHDEAVFEFEYKKSRQVSSPRPMSENRRIVSVELVDSVPVKCIGIDSEDHLFQATRRGILTHNTENTMQMVRAMLSPHNAPKLHEDFELEIGKTMVNVAPAGKLEILSSAARSAEGARCTCVVADELEHWTPAQGGVELFGTLKANLTKTGNRMLETLNSWVKDAGSAGELTFNAWCAQEDGEEREIKRGILYDAVLAPFDTDISDEKSLRAGLEYVYADCPWSLEHLDAIISDIYTSSTSMEASKRKYLNWNVAVEDAWADPHQWALLADRNRPVKMGEEIVMFFDGSLSRDATALVGCCVEDGHIFTIGVWEPGNGRKKGKIDAKVVDARVDQAFRQYNVQAFFADVREWEGYVKNIWPERYADQLAIWATPRGEIPEPIAWDMRGKLKDFTLACELAEAEILEGSFTHDGSAVLSNHITNARRYDNRWGVSIAKESRNSPNKIDAAVCMIGARHALRVLKENAEAPRSFEAFFL